jgi:hypothetical protein
MNRVPSLMGVSFPILAVVTCCFSGGDPAAEQRDPLELPETPQLLPCGGADLEEPAARFRSCLTDDDCVAVPVVGCCHNGWMTSVSRAMKEDYADSFRCPNERPLCPQYLVKDMRVAACNQASYACEMVAVDGSGCNGGWLEDHCVPASCP